MRDRERDVRDDDDNLEEDDEGREGRESPADKWRVLYWCPPGACRACLPPQCLGGMEWGDC